MTGRKPTRAEQGRLELGESTNRPAVRDRRALETTLRAMRELGRVEAIDAARVAIARTLADEVDACRRDPEHSAGSVAYIAKEYRGALGDLLGAALAPADDFADLLAALGDAPAT